MSAPARPSICCSPPDSAPAGRSSRACRAGNSSSTSAGGRRQPGLVVADHPAGQPEVLRHGEAGERAGAAGHEGHAAVGQLVGRPAGGALALRAATCAGGGLEQAADALEHGGLAGAVGAEQGDQLAAGHVEVEARGRSAGCRTRGRGRGHDSAAPVSTGACRTGSTMACVLRLVGECRRRPPRRGAAPAIVPSADGATRSMPRRRATTLEQAVADGAEHLAEAAGQRVEHEQQAGAGEDAGGGRRAPARSPGT